MVTRDMEANAVETVFYPVVPDSFMTRDSAPPFNANAFGMLGKEINSPILAPHDPWSF